MKPLRPYAVVSPDGPVYYKVVSQGTLTGAANGLPGNFVATRSSEAWHSTWVGTPASDHPAGLMEEGVLVGASADFSTLFYETPFGIDPNDQNASIDVYARNPDGSFAWISQSGTREIAQIRSRYVGSSLDGSRVLFATAQALTADDSAQASGLALYERFDDQTRLVGLRTDGSLVGACGAVLAGTRQGGTTITVSSNHAVSDDGSRVFFESPDPAAAGDPSCSPARGGLQPVELYVRQNATATSEISLSQRAGSLGAAAPDGVAYAGASTDGSHVFFTTTDQLTNDAPFRGGLYKYDLTDGALTFIAQGAPLLSAHNDPQVSADGSHVYFVGSGGSGGESLYLWDDGHLSYIASAPSLAQTPSQASADGSTLVFLTSANLTGYDSHGQPELYVYEATTASLTCVSCNPDGAPPVGSPGLGFGGLGVGTDLLNHIVTDDGGMVFFDSPDALVPQASNGKRNVYEYENGAVHLLSAGAGPYESRLIGASSDGRDVIIDTADSLIPQDLDDGEGDLYDVRVDGGFPPPSTPTPCQGEACKPPSSAPSLDQTPGSLSLNGPGNLITLAAPAVRPLTRAQELARSLKACRAKHDRRTRARCESQARRRYGSASKARKTARRAK